MLTESFLARREVILAMLGITAIGNVRDVTAASTANSRSRDFDFIIGKWMVTHRRLKTRLASDSNWDTFAGSCEAYPILGGMGNVDDNVLELPSGTYTGASIRVFDPTQDAWSIWWIDSRTANIAPPVRGGFKAGTGTFYGDEELRGRPVKARFIWSDITDHSARWQQAFSNDNGTSWEVNWFMDFARRS